MVIDEAHGYVFPTCVGVNRHMLCIIRGVVRIPHVRGGEPAQAQLSTWRDEYSPRAWG